MRGIMAYRDTEPAVDTFGAPEYFITDISKIEDAGGNCVRLYCGIRRGNATLTQYTVVMPALMFIAEAHRAVVQAQELFMGTLLAAH